MEVEVIMEVAIMEVEDTMEVAIEVMAAMVVRVGGHGLGSGPHGIGHMIINLSGKRCKKAYKRLLNRSSNAASGCTRCTSSLL